MVSQWIATDPAGWHLSPPRLMLKLKGTEMTELLIWMYCVNHTTSRFMEISHEESSLSVNKQESWRMRSQSHRWNEVGTSKTWFAASNAVSNDESFIVWVPQAWERPPLAGYRRRPRYKSFASAASAPPSISHGYLGAASLVWAWINEPWRMKIFMRPRYSRLCVGLSLPALERYRSI